MNKRGFFLTFPQCKVTKEAASVNLLEVLAKKSQTSIEWAMISQEKHKDGSDHLHVLVWYQKKVNITGRNANTFFDCIAPGHHCNIQSIKNVKKSIAYLKKEDKEPWIHGSPPEVSSSEEPRTTKSDEVAELISSGQKFQTVFEQFPGFALMNKQKIDALVNYFSLQKQSEAMEPWMPLFYLGEEPKTTFICDWVNRNVCQTEPRAFKQKQLYITGPPNHNKTSFCMFLDKRLRIYWCSHDDYFDGYDDDKFDLIVMDEFILKDRQQNRVNSFIDGSPANLVVRYGNILKKKNLPVILLSNYTVDLQYGRKETQKAQMEARVHEVILLEPIDLNNIIFSV
jgi:hypothetical protein